MSFTIKTEFFISTVNITRIMRWFSKSDIIMKPVWVRGIFYMHISIDFLELTIIAKQ